MESARDLFGAFRYIPSKKRQSERGILLEYFASKTGRTIPMLANKLAGLSLQDLYYIRSAASSYENEGKGPFAKAFFGMLKPKPPQ
jgi:hypothetical protein